MHLPPAASDHLLHLSIHGFHYTFFNVNLQPCICILLHVATYYTCPSVFLLLYNTSILVCIVWNIVCLSSTHLHIICSLYILIFVLLLIYFYLFIVIYIYFYHFVLFSLFLITRTCISPLVLFCVLYIYSYIYSFLLHLILPCVERMRCI